MLMRVVRDVRYDDPGSRKSMCKEDHYGDGADDDRDS